MKTRVKILTEIEIAFVNVFLPVRYEEEDIPNDFPRRKGDTWEAEIEIDTGKIKGWPEGKEGHLHMKVCDSGCYQLLGVDGKMVAEIQQNYVPHGLIPGEYGDYVDFKIDKSGVITNWPKHPDLSAFFDNE